tara:strand:- start:19481 stop:19906 length:426 start_codon:yes stop_codon:yes gene_type:complete
MVSVAVMPLPEKSSSNIREEDVTIKTQGGSGPGGQHQNKTDSAVRATHTPTGIQVFINGRSQLDNKRKALEILSRRVQAQKDEEQESRYNERRRQQVAGGSRSGKLRTYNFIEGRVADHRSGRKTNKIKDIMKGRFDLLLE